MKGLAVSKVPECPTHRLVVHARLVLLLTPETRHRLGVEQLEDASLTVSPLDVPRAVFAIVQQHQQKLPQIFGTLGTTSLHSAGAASSRFNTAARALLV